MKADLYYKEELPARLVIDIETTPEVDYMKNVLNYLASSSTQNALKRKEVDEIINNLESVVAVKKNE